jgi:hypothetical protein
MSVYGDYEKLKELEHHRKVKPQLSGQESDDGAKSKSSKKSEVLDNAKSMHSAGKQVKNAVTAFQGIDLSRDVFYFLVIVFSFLADLLTLIPVVGNIFAIMFSAIIWVFYLFSGNLGRRRIAVIIVAQLIEILLPGFNALPFFTISALVVYWLVLIDRKKQQSGQQLQKNK